MSIYAIGAFHHKDVSNDFIESNIVGVGWSLQDAPELHQFMTTLKVGDVVYIKACAFGSSDITVKAIGIIKDSEIKSIPGLVAIARNVKWQCTSSFKIDNPFHKENTEESEKLNHRSNTIYEEFHPYVQSEIISKF